MNFLSRIAIGWITVWELVTAICRYGCVLSENYYLSARSNGTSSSKFKVLLDLSKGKRSTIETSNGTKNSWNHHQSSSLAVLAASAPYAFSL